MFCPSCRDEFRAGFTRCATCDVELVEHLAAAPPEAVRTAPAVPPLRLVDCCGFLALDEARGVRERLRERGIRSEIVLRDGSDSDPQATAREEWWLRVDASRGPEVAAILEEEGAVQPVEPAPTEDAGETFECGDCGQRVAEDEVTCSGCGARFEE